MKKTYALILALAVMLFSSCSSSARMDFSIDEALENYDYNQGLSHLGASCAITDNTVYFMNAFSFSSKKALRYADKASGIGGSLCGKPECTHKDDTCNSYIYAPIAGGLSDYDGALYWSGADTSGYYIYRGSYDGTKRSTVRKLDSQIMNKLSFNPFSFAHRGYMYFCGGTSGIENGKQKLGAIVLAYDLMGDEDGITIFEKDYSEYTVVSTGIQPYKNELYIMTALKDADKNILELYKWDTKTRELENVYGEEVPFFANEFYITDNGIFISDTDSGNIYSYSFESKEVSHCLDLNAEGGEFDRIFITNGLFVGQAVKDGGQAIRAVDFTGRLILDKSFSVDVLEKDRIHQTTFFGADDSCLYFYYSDYISGGHSEYLIAYPLDGGEAKMLWEEED